MYFNIYVGLTSDHYVGTYDCKDKDEALDLAYELAVEEYDMYAGLHGIPDWGEIESEIREEFADEIENGMINDLDIESMTQEAYTENIESWINYNAIPMDEDYETGSDEIEYC